MGASNSEQSKTNFYALKAKTSDQDPAAYFGHNTKQGDSWAITEKFNTFSGHLTDIKHSTYQYEGETKNKVEFTLKDADGTTNILSANFSNLTYSLLNSLAGCNPEKIEMNLSLGKAKVIDGKMGKQYPSIWVKNNGEEVKWKYEFAAIPKATDVKVGNKTVKDDTKVVEFWIKVINEIKPKLTAIGEVKTESQGEPILSQNDDLPF